VVLAVAQDIIAAVSRLWRALVKPVSLPVRFTSLCLCSANVRRAQEIDLRILFTIGKCICAVGQRGERAGVVSGLEEARDSMAGSLCGRSGSTEAEQLTAGPGYDISRTGRRMGGGWFSIATIMTRWSSG